MVCAHVFKSQDPLYTAGVYWKPWLFVFVINRGASKNQAFWPVSDFDPLGISKSYNISYKIIDRLLLKQMIFLQFCIVVLPLKLCVKVHIFWEGHKFLRYLHCRFD